MMEKRRNRFPSSDKPLPMAISIRMMCHVPFIPTASYSPPTIAEAKIPAFLSSILLLHLFLLCLPCGKSRDAGSIP